MSDKAFVDTNILVYAHDRGSGEKHGTARDLIEEMWRNRNGVLSTQVLQEFYVNVRRKAIRPIPAAEATQLLSDYLAWEIVVNDGPSILDAIELERQYKISFWDALIVQAAAVSRTSVLYSEDLSHEQRYSGVTVLNPFLS